MSKKAKAEEGARNNGNNGRISGGVPLNPGKKPPVKGGASGGGCCK